jgi:hypothetical protein
MPDVQPPVPPDVWAGLFAPLVSAGAGLAMRHAQRFEAGKPFQWRKIAVDVPLLIGASVLSAGVAEYMGWGQKTACAVAVLLAYFGTHALDALWLKLQAAIVAKAGAA